MKSLVWDEAQKISGKDPDFHRRDLFEAIERDPCGPEAKDLSSPALSQDKPGDTIKGRKVAVLGGDGVDGKQLEAVKDALMAHEAVVELIGSRGSTDCARDVRGFAVKFYSDEGIWDLVGNNMPVFFIQDAIKFPDLIHAVKPEPNNEIPQAASAHGSVDTGAWFLPL